MVLTEKNDFIELDFTGIIKDTKEVFDTTVKVDADKIGVKDSSKVKPVIISIGNKMTVKGLDEDLTGKEIGKEYSVELKSEDAFGKRNPSMIKMIPLKLFIEQRIMPERGMQLSLDVMVVKIISVSGGRVLVDFNNPLSGKVVVYNYKVLRKVEDIKEKINALQEFFFRRTLEFEIDGKDLTLKVDKNMQKFIEMMSKPFEEILGFKVKTEVVSEKKEDKKEESTK